MKNVAVFLLSVISTSMFGPSFEKDLRQAPSVNPAISTPPSVKVNLTISTTPSINGRACHECEDDWLTPFTENVMQTEYFTEPWLTKFTDEPCLTCGNGRFPEIPCHDCYPENLVEPPCVECEAEMIPEPLCDECGDAPLIIVEPCDTCNEEIIPIEEPYCDTCNEEIIPIDTCLECEPEICEECDV